MNKIINFKRYWVIRLAGKRKLLAKIHYRVTLESISYLIRARAPIAHISPEAAEELINGCQKMLYKDLLNSL